MKKKEGWHIKANGDVENWFQQNRPKKKMQDIKYVTKKEFETRLSWATFAFAVVIVFFIILTLIK